jgi:tRNA A37 threonylcarbamoyltransferase TsaD
MVDDLVSKTLAAARSYDVATLFVTGGVAANGELRQRFEKDATMDGLPVFFPSRPLSTDNAAMIAAAAYPKYLAGDLAPADFSAEAGLAFQALYELGVLFSGHDLHTRMLTLIHGLSLVGDWRRRGWHRNPAT